MADQTTMLDEPDPVAVRCSMLDPLGTPQLRDLARQRWESGEEGLQNWKRMGRRRLLDEMAADPPPLPKSDPRPTPTPAPQPRCPGTPAEALAMAERAREHAHRWLESESRHGYGEGRGGIIADCPALAEWAREEGLPVAGLDRATDEATNIDLHPNRSAWGEACGFGTRKGREDLLADIENDLRRITVHARARIETPAVGPPAEPDEPLGHKWVPMGEVQNRLTIDPSTVRRYANKNPSVKQTRDKRHFYHWPSLESRWPDRLMEPPKA